MVFWKLATQHCHSTLLKLSWVFDFRQKSMHSISLLLMSISNIFSTFSRAWRNVGNLVLQGTNYMSKWADRSVGRSSVFSLRHNARQRRPGRRRPRCSVSAARLAPHLGRILEKFLRGHQSCTKKKKKMVNEAGRLHVHSFFGIQQNLNFFSYRY